MGMKYPWKRFWCPRDGEINLSDGEFLVDPDTEHADYLKLDAVPFDKIGHLPCLALLGEPGIGKTTAMEDLRDDLREAAATTGETLHYVNLSEYGNESRLITEVFGDEIFTAWVSGRHVMHLFLDSLDECRLRIANVASIIKRRLENVRSHLPRLRLRIGCRTADWPSLFDELFPELWSEEEYGAFELAPLRRKDVEAAADAHGIDFEQFSGELDRTETVPFAIKPITLRFLLETFQDAGRLPTTRRELYERGCTMLCDEWNRERLNPGETGKLTAPERMVVASRIAAVCVFCGKTSIAMGPVTLDEDGEEAHVSVLVGGDEPTDNGNITITRAAIDEALRTGLFTSRGAGLMGFAHKTYAEFLASRYVLSHDMGVKKELSLLQHPGELNGSIVPQLYEVAGWMASGNKHVLDAIVKCDPQILLRGDTASLSDSDREMIVDALLCALHDRWLNDRNWGLRRQYGKLKHDGLSEQLKPWITDKTKYYVARDTAIDIVEECGLTELQDELAEIALDTSEVMRLRYGAANAAAGIADADTRRRLLPLVSGDADDDPEDQLKGSALRAVWPDLIGAEELFNDLSCPKKKSFFGAYLGFLRSDLIEHLKVDDLPHALAWLKRLSPHGDAGYMLHLIFDEIIVLVWRHLDAPVVLTALAETCIERFKHYGGLLCEQNTLKDNPGLFDTPKTRLLLAAKIVELSEDRGIQHDLTDHSPRLIRQEDFSWCIEQLVASIGRPTESVWAGLVWSLFCWSKPDSGRLSCIIETRVISECLRTESELFFTPVELDSERAIKLREGLELSLSRTEREPEYPEPAPQVRIEQWLDRFEKGESKVWWMLRQDMTLENTSTSYPPVPLDLRTTPGWMRSGSHTRQRILAAADGFLRHAPLDPLKWCRESGWGHYHTAAFAAFYLLQQEATDTYTALPEAIWSRHAASILCTPCFDADEEQKLQHREIALKCYEEAKEAFLFYLLLQLDAEDKDRGHVSCDRKLGLCWDEGLKETLHEKLVESQKNWQASTFEQVAEQLLVHGHQPTFQLLTEIVNTVTEGACPDLERADLAGAGLIKHRSDAAWSVIWPAVSKDREYGRSLLMAVAHGLHHDISDVASKLTYPQLAGLFIWLVREFPYSEDPRRDGAYFVGPDDSVRQFRDAIIPYLEHAGAPGSVMALQSVSEALPDLDWISSVLIEARKNTLRKTWTPLIPAEMIAYGQPSGWNIVQQYQKLTSLQKVLVWVAVGGFILTVAGVILAI